MLINKSKNAADRGSKDVRIAVDNFGTLYLTDVTKDEDGTYSCFDNGLPIVKFLIRIEPNNLIFTKGESILFNIASGALIIIRLYRTSGVWIADAIMLSFVVYIILS